jgi:DNA repair protein RecO (recombination protein O)
MTNLRREHVYRTEALVIGRLDLGEVDRIFTLFTPRFGKFRVIAKGVRRPSSRLAPHLELLSESRLLLAKGRELDIVTGAETVDSHWALRDDLDAYGNACYLAELMNQLTEDRQEMPAAYELLARSIHLLAGGVSGFAVVRHYEFALLTLLGFRPQLYDCAQCGTQIQSEENALSARLGGMLCPACRTADAGAPLLSVNAQKFLRLLDRSGLSAAAALEVDPLTAAAIERTLTHLMRHHAEREARSLGVIHALHARTFTGSDAGRG